MTVESELAARVGPILSDGTPLRDLIDLDKREVSMRVLHDPEVHRLELKRIFARTWVMVAHESEIPNPGDFVTRFIGEDPVIVTRTADGEVSIMLNVCAHRGMPLCRAEAGNEMTFKCPYHGWLFDGTGKLLGAPFERAMYGEWDKSKYGVRRARAAIRHGVIFGSFGADVPPLDEFLGDIAYYFDLVFSVAEFEVVGPPVENLFATNWKLISEQSTGDSYHNVTLHESARELGLLPPAEDLRSAYMDIVKVSSPEGHCIIGNEGTVPLYQDSETDHPGYKDPADWDMTIGTLFPGISTFFSFAVPVEGGRTYQANLAWHSPRGQGGSAVSVIPLLAKDAPEGLGALSRKMSGVSNGLISVDDNDAWVSTYSATGGVIGQEETLKYNMVRSDPRPPEGWPGPGMVYAGVSRDDTQWNFWLHWLECMTAEN